MFLIDLFFFNSFCSNLSISSIDKVIGLKIVPLFFFLLFSSVSFSSLSLDSILVLYIFFLILKGCFLPLKIGFFAYCLSILSQYFRFYNLNVLSFSFLYLRKKLQSFKTRNIIFKTIHAILK